MLALVAFTSLAPFAAAQPPSLRQPFGDAGPVRHFELTDSQGRPFTPEQLRGKVWVAHFFFTTCTQGCSQTTETMKELQDRYRSHPHLALVSISVNPQNDSAEVLQDYARRLDFVPDQWFFVRGPEKEVHEIVEKGFYQGAARNEKPEPGREIIHSFALVLVDHEGRLVGYVDGKDAANRPALEDRIEELLRARFAAAEPARVWFPRVNAALNGLCALLLLAGYLAIRQRQERLHIACMLAALAVSAIFLA
jgi:protein SCO1/2